MRAKTDRSEARVEGTLPLVVGEATFGADQGQHACGLSGEHACCGQPSGIREQAEGGWLPLAAGCGQAHRLGNLHQRVAAALLAGLDHLPAEAADGRRGGLSDAAGSGERQQAGGAELGEFLHHPFLAIALGQGRCDCEQGPAGGLGAGLVGIADDGPLHQL